METQRTSSDIQTIARDYIFSRILANLGGWIEPILEHDLDTFPLTADEIREALAPQLPSMDALDHATTPEEARDAVLFFLGDLADAGGPNIDRASVPLAVPDPDPTTPNWWAILDEDGETTNSDPTLNGLYREWLDDNHRGWDDTSELNAPEVYEWYAVDYDLARELGERGEIILDGGYFKVWGRQGTGQAIYLDNTIQEIALSRVRH